MAEILIKGMEMPPSCRWHNTNGRNTSVEICSYLQSCPAEFNFDDCRPSGCPIKGQIPDEHGRLIDADEAKELIVHAFTCSKKLTINDILGLIDNAPTIVEASE